MTKKIVLEIEFEEDYRDDELDYVHYGPARVKRTYTDPELDIDALGEEIAQSDSWQVDNWNIIQYVLGVSEATEAELI